MRYMDSSRFWACDFWALLVILTCSCLLMTASGDPRTAVAGQFCGNSSSISDSAFAINSVPAMDNLSSTVTSNRYGTVVISQAPNAVFVLGQCMEDLSPTDCKLCFSEIRSLLLKCYPNTTGRLYLDGCFGRYANYSFFDDVIDSLDQSVCTTGNNSASPKNFGKAVGEVIGNVTAEAIQNKGFAVGSASISNTPAYALAQCWQNLTRSQCSTCLNAAASSIVSCLPAVEGRALFAGCYMRYSTKLFWNVYPNGSSSSVPNDLTAQVAEGISYLHKESKTRIIHRDRNASNIILLDDKFNPDFGFARRERSLSEDLMERARFRTVAFSFGLEIIDTVIQKGHRSLMEIGRHYYHDTLEEIVDKIINEENTKEYIRRVIHIALSCMQADPINRPTMAKVVELLREARHDSY